MDLIQLSKNKNFISRDRLIAVNEEYYYLWMCELQRWLREKHNIHIGTVCNNLQDLLFSSEIIYIGDCLVTNTHKTYEKALEEGLYEALKLIKTK